MIDVTVLVADDHLDAIDDVAAALQRGRAAAAVHAPRHGRDHRRGGGSAPRWRRCRASPRSRPRATSACRRRTHPCSSWRILFAETCPRTPSACAKWLTRSSSSSQRASSGGRPRGLPTAPRAPARRSCGRGRARARPGAAPAAVTPRRGSARCRRGGARPISATKPGWTSRASCSRTSSRAGFSCGAEIGVELRLERARGVEDRQHARDDLLVVATSPPATWSRSRRKPASSHAGPPPWAMSASSAATTQSSSTSRTPACGAPASVSSSRLPSVFCTCAHRRRHVERDQLARARRHRGGLRRRRSRARGRPPSRPRRRAPDSRGRPGRSRAARSCAAARRRSSRSARAPPAARPRRSARRGASARVASRSAPRSLPSATSRPWSSSTRKVMRRCAGSASSDQAPARDADAADLLQRRGRARRAAGRCAA